MTENPIDESSILKKGFEQSIDGIAVADMDGIITFANEAWADMHDMDVTEILNKPLSQFHNEDQLKNDVASFNEKVFAEGKHIGYVGHIKKDGTPFPTWMSVTAMSNDDGEPLGLLAVCRDMSEIEAYEAEIIKQKEAAEMANILKNEFLLKVSHELCTPMNGILGSTHLLESSPLDSEQKEFIDLLKISSTRLMSLIDNLLKFSTIDLADGKEKRVEFGISKLIDDLIDSLSNQAAEKGVSLLKDIADEVPKTTVHDRERIRHILFNLISNGLKFTQEGEVKIALNLDDSSGPVKHLRFQISDTGIGISSEYIDRVFDSFSQEDSTFSRKYQGMGIGLHISKVLAERLGGSLTVQSTLGKGSTFCLSVPLD